MIKITKQALEGIVKKSLDYSLRLNLSAKGNSFAYREAFGYLIGSEDLILKDLDSLDATSIMVPNKEVHGKVDYFVRLKSTEIDRVLLMPEWVGTYHTHTDNLQPSESDFEMVAYLDKRTGKLGWHLIIGNLERFILRFRELTSTQIHPSFLYKAGEAFKEEYIKQIIESSHRFVVTYGANRVVSPVIVV